MKPITAKDVRTAQLKLIQTVTSFIKHRQKDMGLNDAYKNCKIEYDRLYKCSLPKPY